MMEPSEHSDEIPEFTDKSKSKPGERSDEIPEFTDKTKSKPGERSDEIPEFTDKSKSKLGKRSDEIPEFTDKSKSESNKRQKMSKKSLFKMKIGVLQSLEFNYVTEDSFIFKNHDLSLVACGGTVTDIYSNRLDDLFKFELDDNSGTILCFHKFKYNREADIKKLNDLLESTQISHMRNQTQASDVSVFNTTNDNSVIQNEEIDPNEAFREVMAWFQEEVVEKTKPPQVGDSVHVMGYLIYNDTIRKIQVLDFRVITNPKERKDLEMEIDYLNRCVY